MERGGFALIITAKVRLFDLFASVSSKWTRALVEELETDKISGTPFTGLSASSLLYHANHYYFFIKLRLFCSVGNSSMFPN